MYIYLDKQGVVKEIINDEALRQNASNVNEIYVYYDGLQESDIGSVLATYGLPDGTITDEMQVATQTQESEIPYNAERDLKYFQYYKAYAFYHFAIADLALSQEGVVRLMIRLAQKTANTSRLRVLFVSMWKANWSKKTTGYRWRNTITLSKRGSMPMAFFLLTEARQCKATLIWGRITSS